MIFIAGQRAGYISVKNHENGIYIDNIQLSPAVQGLGIGTAILRRLIRDHDFEEIHLTTFVDNPARRLYERLGFLVVQREGETVRMSRLPESSGRK